MTPDPETDEEHDDSQDDAQREDERSDRRAKDQDRPGATIDDPEPTEPNEPG